MADPIKVYRTAAFAPLAQEIGRFGAISKAEALTHFDPRLLAAARRRVSEERDTKIGKVLGLLHAGRKLIGLAGAFTPTDKGLMDAVCLRQAVLRLEQQGLELDLTTRKRSAIYTKDGRKILVLAQHNGYNFAALRRRYNELLETNLYDEIHMYSYLSGAELTELAKTLYEPARQSKPLKRDRLRLERLPLPDEVWPPREAASTN
jgi:hypothetical protein